MKYAALSEITNRYPDPVNAHRSPEDRFKVFPDAYYYPLYQLSVATVEISCNAQDFTDSGINYIYQEDAVITSVSPNLGQVNEVISMIITGLNFVNSSLLSCRIGDYITPAIFLNAENLMCFTPRVSKIVFDHGYLRNRQTLTETLPQARVVETLPRGAGPNEPYVEVSNNGQDFTNYRKTFKFEVECGPGYYCAQLLTLPCPRGTFCPGKFNTNYTLCPSGTYQPRSGQAECARCPVGFCCPEEGMHVPRICPRGKVCESTGIIIADVPCPMGHWCPEGTATSSTTCGTPDLSSDLFPTSSHGERTSTLRKNRIAQGQKLFFGS
jgi:hypothetical protein